MNSRYLEDDDLDAPRDREISLGATTLLGIFLLLALICAVFFGFGYSMGRRSAVSVAPATDAVEAATTLKTTGGTKPAPGLTPAPKPSAESADQTSASSDDSASAPQRPQPVHAPTVEAAEPSRQKPQPSAAASAKPAAYSPPAPQFNPPAVVSKAAPPPAAPHSAVTAAPAGPPALVQVAAVSHQEDADTLVNALKRRGYEVAVRHEPQDKLFHIQLGPYATHKDADTMRQRLLADGYNAIVK